MQIWCPLPDVDQDLKDDDVLEQEANISDGSVNKDNSVILVEDLKKMYRGGKFAVRGVSLGIPNGECFGLLGINGAGKSSTLSMLSGEFSPSDGHAYLAGLDLFTDIHQCRRKIGYCPQFDALFELLTAREHLQLYARIKGIAEKRYRPCGGRKDQRDGSQGVRRPLRGYILGREQAKIERSNSHDRRAKHCVPR